jgi:hypothetical protein
MFKTPEQMGIDLPKLLEICEELWSNEKLRNCHDCDAKPGEQHDPNCDVARCTSCGGQRLSCDCSDGDTDIWTGLWPGIKECYEQHLICYDDNSGFWCFDLNTYYS